MRLWALAFASISACSSGFGQGPQGGGMGGMGQAVYQGDSVGLLESQLSHYVGQFDLSSVLTPGEFVEWKLNLNAGQVVIAEAKSDSFDAALQVVDANGKVLAFNDDRYPGDQRPLLLWHADKKGVYGLRVRSFRDKFGGGFNADYKIYNCFDAGSGQRVEASVNGGEEFLLRIPMKAGQIKQVVSEKGPNRNDWDCASDQAIAPNGLPDINLAKSFQRVTKHFVLLAPVSGYYYALAMGAGPGDRGRVRVSVRDVPIRKLTNSGSPESATAPAEQPTAWELPVKKGQVLELSSTDPMRELRVQEAEAPDISKFNLTKDELNPFYPHKSAPPDRLPLVQHLLGRPLDDTVQVIYANRSGKLLVAISANSAASSTFKLRLRPDRIAFTEGALVKKKLRLGDTDYWSIEANAGDVMSFESHTDAFIQAERIYDPSMAVIQQSGGDPHSHSATWRLVIQRPGQYLQAMSCAGNGGGGEYSVSRRVIHPKEFKISNPAGATISANGVQAWKFSVQPSIPLLIHWKSTNWSYDVAVYDDKGNASDFEKQAVDAHNKFGILKVSKPQSFVIVLTGRGQNATYSIDLNTIPGYGKGGAR